MQFVGLLDELSRLPINEGHPLPIRRLPILSLHHLMSLYLCDGRVCLRLLIAPLRLGEEGVLDHFELVRIDARLETVEALDTWDHYGVAQFEGCVSLLRVLDAEFPFDFQTLVRTQPLSHPVDDLCDDGLTHCVGLVAPLLINGDLVRIHI